MENAEKGRVIRNESLGSLRTIPSMPVLDPGGYVSIGFTFSSAKAENTTPKIPFKSVDDQMAILTEKLKLTPEQETEIRPIIQDFSEKRQALFQKYQGKGRGAYKDLFSEAKTLNEEMKSKLKPILTADQIEAYTKLRDEQRSEMREELKNRRKSHSDQ